MVSLVRTSGVAQQQYGCAPASSARPLHAAVAAIEAAAVGAAVFGAAVGGGDSPTAPSTAANVDPLYAVATRPFASQPVHILHPLDTCPTSATVARAAPYLARCMQNPARPLRALQVRTQSDAQRRQCWEGLDSAMALHGLGSLPGLFLPSTSHKRILFVAGNGSGTYW